MSMTPDQSKKVGLGMVTASPSPFLTPRPERRRPESRGSDRNPHRQDKDKETNVQVLLRCRSFFFILSLNFISIILFYISIIVYFALAMCNLI
jgi:hypothetical protein